MGFASAAAGAALVSMVTGDGVTRADLIQEKQGLQCKTGGERRTDVMLTDGSRMSHKQL